MVDETAIDDNDDDDDVDEIIDDHEKNKTYEFVTNNVMIDNGINV